MPRQPIDPPYRYPGDDLPSSGGSTPGGAPPERPSVLAWFIVAVVAIAAIAVLVVLH